MRLMADWYHNNNGRNNKTTGAASVREILDDNLLLIISDNDGDKDFWTGLDSPFIHVVNSGELLHCLIFCL